MDTILAYRWLLLGSLEVVAWSVTFAMLYARYKLRSERWFKRGAVLFFLTGVFPQAGLGILNYLAVGAVDVFTLVIAGLLLYGSTVGRRQVRKLDAWAKRYFAQTGHER